MGLAIFKTKARHAMRDGPSNQLVRIVLQAACNVFPVDQVIQEVGQVDRTLVTEVDVV